MSAEIELSELDHKILGLADYSSPEQISETLGGALTPARVRLRLEALLANTNWITEAQREALIVRRMHLLLHNLENTPGAKWDINNLKVQLAALKELGNRLDKRRQASEVDLERYDRNVAAEMARVYDVALSYVKGALRAEVDADRWDELARDALAHAQAELMKKAVEG